jgi:hypothetical protein
MTIETTFNGLGMSLRNLFLFSAAQTRSISAENFDGRKGRGGMTTDSKGAVPGRGNRPGMEGVAEHRHSRARRGDFGGAANLHTLELPTVLPGINEH